MSEFSDSYHLLSPNQQEAITLLQKAGVEGYVFPPANGWVTLVADGFVFRPNFALIDTNEGILVHLVSAVDHGWYFSLYQGSKQLAHYECYWEDELFIHDTEFNLPLVKDLIKGSFKLDPQSAQEELQKIFYPEELDYSCHPVTRLANLLGLEYVDWVAYSCVHEDQQNGTGRYPVSPVK